MKTQTIKTRLLLILFMLPIASQIYGSINQEGEINPELQRADTIENFDTGVISLKSYSYEDEEPQAWELNSGITYNNSPYSLKLFGNTWKQQNIRPIVVDSGTVWQVSAYIDSKAEIQGFGLMDSANVLLYAFAGTEEINPHIWIPVYQGNFPENQWNEYQLPIADDWLAAFDYMPKIIGLVYINDKDYTSQGVVYFDQILNITDDLPCAPDPIIDFSITNVINGNNDNNTVVEFLGEVVDPDSDTHDYFWDFGDGSSSTEQNPQHTYTVTDDHAYTVLLRVVDPTNMWGQASCKIDIDPGSSSFPLTLNFVGDVMMARQYEYPGGIIPTQGVEALFEPTLPYLGQAADITVANLECPLTTHWQHHPTKTIYFKSSPENVQGLIYAGIDIVSLANNHILDYMQPGMLETQSVLDENNIVHSGAGGNSYEAYLPTFYSKSGVNFAFLAASDRTGQYNNYQPFLNAGYNKFGFANLNRHYIKKQINEVKDVSDLVIIEWHAGDEYSTTPGNNFNSSTPFAEDCLEDEDYSPLMEAPSKTTRELRQFAIDNGADLVICHHPHIIQGVELYNGKLIAHSLGNFVFDLGYPETFHSMILNTKVDGSGFYEFSITPVYIDHFIPKRAEGGLGLYILDELAKYSKKLNTYLKVDRENVTAEIIMDTLNMSTYEVDYSTELPLVEVNGVWESAVHPLKREGSISSITNIEPSGTYEFRLGSEKIWFGNMENEGCSLWNLNSNDELFCDSVAYTGQRSIQHRRDANSPYNIVTNFEKRIICRYDTLKYSLCGYIKTQNGANVTIEVQYFKNRTGGSPIAIENIGAVINGDTPWAFYNKSLTIPNGTEFFDVRLNSGTPQTDTAYSWFDNVSIVRWDTWGDYEITQPIPVPNNYYFVQVQSEDNSNKITINYSETIFGEFPVGIDDSKIIEQEDSGLKQNYPNPFNPNAGSTSIPFSLQKPAKVNVTIYTIMGQKVRVLADTEFSAGNHKLYWDGKNSHGYNMDSGTYFYKLETQNSRQIKKCILLRF